jgi:hypothetical protein
MNRTIQFARAADAFLFACLFGGATGCETGQQYSMTCRLWANDEFRNFHEPARCADMKLYQAPRGGDVLVVYNEANERNDSIRRRAYLLMANDAKVRAGRKPRFVNPKTAGDLAPIPVVAAMVPGSITNGPACAVAPVDGKAFTVFRGGWAQGPYELPVYAAHGSAAVRAFLTPIAVVGDTLVFGVFLLPLWGPALSGQSL